MRTDPLRAIPTFDLYGEHHAFPDVLHCETITDRAALHDWRISVHRHTDLHQFFSITAGSAEVTVEGAVQRLALPALVTIPRLAAHGFRFAQGTAGHVVTLPMAELPEAFGEGSPIAQRLSHWGTVPGSAELRGLVARLAAEHRGAGFGRVPLLRGLVLQLAAEVARGLNDASPASEHPYARRMVALDALIAARLRSRWRVADYADALGMTPTHLSRVTRAEAGLSASRYIERHLFREARRLLAYTRMGVGEIAFALGFEDAAYFSRAFRRHEGEPPLAYRDRVGAG